MIPSLKSPNQNITKPISATEDIKNQIFDELANQELEVESNVEPVLVSEYDVGEVEIEQPIVDEVS